MPYLPLLHIACLLGYGLLALYLLIKNSSAPLNRTCAVILVCFMLWCLGKSVSHHPAAPLELAELFRHFVIVGAWTFSSFLLIFALIITERSHLLARRWAVAGLFAIPAVSILLQWHDARLLSYVQRPFGWGLAWNPGGWSTLLLVHIFATTIAAAVMTFVYSLRVRDKNRQKQARIVGVSIFIGITLGKQAQDLYQVIIDDPTTVAQEIQAGVKSVREYRPSA